MTGFYLDEDVTEHLATALIALDYDVTTAGWLGTKGQKDPDQLLIAAQLDRIFVTYNADDFKVLQEAWHSWPRAWAVAPRPHHRGILIIHPSRNVTPLDIAAAIHDHVTTVGSLDDKLFAWTLYYGWREIT